MSNKHSRKPVFLKAKELLAKYKKPQIVLAIMHEGNYKISYTTLHGYTKFDTYEEYAEYQTKRLAKYKAPTPKKVVKVLNKAIKENRKQTDDTWFEDMLAESKKQTGLLLGICDRLEKRRIF